MKTKYIEYPTDEADLLKFDTSEGVVRDFLESTLHEDFQRELDLRIEMLTAMLDDADQQYSGRDYDIFRGGKRAFTEVRNLFTDFYNGIIERKEHVE